MSPLDAGGEPWPDDDRHVLDRRVAELTRDLLEQRRRLDASRERVWALLREKQALENEVSQRRLAEELAHGQSEILIQPLAILAHESNLDTFLGHVLKATCDLLGGVGGTLWFPDRANNTACLHLEYVDSRIIPAALSRHPAVRCPPPVGGGPLSTFPDRRAETYVLAYEVAGMPEENRAYIMSLGVRALLTVPMLLGRDPVGWMCIRSGRVDAREIESKIRVAEALAGQATLAMQMVKLSEQARQAAVLEERNRIARDIHDTLAQGFTGVVLNLAAAVRALDKDNVDLALEHIEHSRNLAQSGLQEARLSVRALRPDTHADSAIEPQLEALRERLATTGSIMARVAIGGEARPLARNAQNELVRIAQESVTNIMKHARARNVLIALDHAGDHVRLAIGDDGIGFDTQRAHEGFGLVGMGERAERLGGLLTVDSAPGRGTHVLVKVPAASAYAR